MSNIISDKINDTPDLILNNGLMSVFISVICLAGAKLSDNNDKAAIMVWFGGKDQFILGNGMAGFDISDIPWEKEIFAKQKEFLLKAIDEAFSKSNWEHLNYLPSESLLFPALSRFRQMIEKYTFYKSVNYESETKTEFTICVKHHIYQHDCGCIICNDEIG